MDDVFLQNGGEPLAINWSVRLKDLALGFHFYGNIQRQMVQEFTNGKQRYRGCGATAHPVGGRALWAGVY